MRFTTEWKVMLGTPNLDTGEGQDQVRELSGHETLEEDLSYLIAGFQNRILTAQNELAALPEGYLQFKQHKRREKQRRDLQSEIEHVNILIGYAREGIAIRQTDTE